MPLSLRYLSFELSEGDEGVTTLDAMAASRSPADHAAARAEADLVLAWCRREFPHSHGPVEDGMDWDHELQALTESDGWHSVTLTLTGSSRFVAAFEAAFAEAPD